MLEKLDLSQALYKGNDYDQYLRDLWTRSEKMLKEIGIIKEAATQPY